MGDNFDLYVGPEDTVHQRLVFFSGGNVVEIVVNKNETLVLQFHQVSELIVKRSS